MILCLEYAAHDCGIGDHLHYKPDKQHRCIGDHLHEKLLFAKHNKAVVMAMTPTRFQEAKKKCQAAQQPGTTKRVRMPGSEV